MKKTISVIVFLFFVCGGVGLWHFSRLNIDKNFNKTPQPAKIINLLPSKSQSLETEINLANGKKFKLYHPAGYLVSVVGEGFKKLRFMAESPDNRLFVAEMFSSSDTKKGRVLIFENFDNATKKFKTNRIYLSNLRNPNSVAFYTDQNNQTWFYIALTDKLLRYKYKAGDNKPEGSEEVVTTFPDYGSDWSNGGWHITRTLAFVKNKLYVSVGSSCNSCEEKISEPERAAILQMNPDGSEKKVFANGLRNSVGLVVAEGQLYGTNNAADHFGDDRPNDNFYKMIEGKNYGWPYCYEFGGKILEDKTKKWKTNFSCQTVPLSTYAFLPHSAPLGADYFQKTFVVALHGSGKRQLGQGYKVVGISGSSVSDLIWGFLNNGQVYGRPAGILTHDSNSFFVTDDFNGVIYLVNKQ